MNNTFYGIEPNLIINTTLQNIEAPLNITYPKEGNKIFDGIGNFYNNYISPNMFSIIVICCFAIYLFINYVIKKDKEEKKIIKEKEEIQELTDNDISNYISDDYLISETNTQ
jgi:hypothetical protein